MDRLNGRREERLDLRCLGQESGLDPLDLGGIIDELGVGGALKEGGKGISSRYDQGYPTIRPEVGERPPGGFQHHVQLERLGLCEESARHSGLVALGRGQEQ